MKKDVVRNYMTHESICYSTNITNPISPKASKSITSGPTRKRRFTKASSKYRCEWCKKIVDHSETNHEMECCSAFDATPAFGGSMAFSPIKRARIAEYTAKRLRLDRVMSDPT